MQLVQPSKFFSVTIIRTRSIGGIGMRACELGLCCYFLVTLKNFDVCTVTMHGSCMPSSPKEYISPWRYGLLPQPNILQFPAELIWACV